MGNIMKTAKCRFCGQMTKIENDEELTTAQAEEQATMTCNCPDAVEYQKGNCEDSQGSSRGDLHRRTGKGHIEPPWRCESLYFAE